MNIEEKIFDKTLDRYTEVVNPELFKEMVFLCEYFKMSWIDIVSPSRKKQLVEVRHIISSYLYDKFIGKYTREDIGMLMGFRDHSTSSHSSKTVMNWINTNRKFKIKYDNFKDYAETSGMVSSPFNNVPQL